MGQYWKEMLTEAIWKSLLVFFDDPKKGIGLFVLGLSVTTAIVWKVRSKEAFTEHWKSNIAIPIAGGVCTWILVLLYCLVVAPSDNSSELKARLSRSETDARSAIISREAAGTEIENLRSQLRTCKSASCTLTQNAGLELLYGEQPLKGQAIPAIDRRSSLNITVGNLRARNKGHTTTGRVHLRLYFSEKIDSHMPGIWVPTASDEPSFPSEFYLNLGDDARIDGLEVFNFEPEFSGTLDSQTPEVRAKLKCFYGAKSPAVADFLIEQKVY